MINSAHAQLFDGVRELIRAEEWHSLGPYRGTGTVGTWLENRLGLEATNREIPDAHEIGWELKTTNKKAPVTLFHLDPRNPPDAIKDMVQIYGWQSPNGNGCMSFRHTIWGRSSRGFQVCRDEGRLVVRHVSENGPQPYWMDGELEAKSGSKLRRLLLVGVERRKDAVRFLDACAFETFVISKFIDSCADGVVAVDFDAREMQPGSVTVRNHGTKFRIKPNMVGALYLRRMDLACGDNDFGPFGEDEVKNLRWHYFDNGVPIKHLAATYRITEEYAQEIVNRKTWKHI